MNDQKKKLAFKIKQLLDLSYNEQSSWIETHIPNFDEQCYGEGYLGAFYPSEPDLNDFLNDPEDYGVSRLIASQNAEISEARLNEINAGAELTETERKNLIAAIAEQDVDGWITVTLTFTSNQNLLKNTLQTKTQNLQKTTFPLHQVYQNFLRWI